MSNTTEMLVLLQQGVQALEEGKQLFKSKNARDALRKYDISIEALAGANRELQRLIAETSCAKAEALIDCAKHYKAYQECANALHFNPDSLRTIRLKSCALMGLHKYADAAAELQKALSNSRRLEDEHEVEEVKKLLRHIDDIQHKALPELPALKRLPVNIWLKIFTLLDVNSKVRLDQVCRSWRELAEKAWSNIVSIPGSIGEVESGIVTPEYFDGLVRKCGFSVRSVNLACVDVSLVQLEGFGRFRLRNKLRKLLDLLAEWCPRLQELNIPNAAIIDEDLEFVFDKFRELQSLIFRKVVRTPDEGSFTGCAFQHCPSNLHTLSLTISQLCPCISDDALNFLADRCSESLVVFELHKHCGGYVSDSALRAFLQRCHKIEKLSLQYFGEPLDTELDSCVVHVSGLHALTHLCLWLPRIPDEAMTSIVAACTRLSTIEIHTGQLSAKAMLALATLRNIRDLRLDVPQSIPWPQLISDVAQSSPGLEILALTSVSEDDFSLALNLLHNLRQFCLWSVVDMNAETLERLLTAVQFQRTAGGVLTVVASCYDIDLTDSLRAMLQRSRDESLHIVLACFIDHQTRHCDFDMI